MRRRVIALAAVLAGCGDNRAPAVEIVSDGAAWIATRAAPDQAWRRHDGATARFDADPAGRPYDVVVVCRADVGAGWSLTATYVDGLAWRRACAGVAPTTVTVGFDLASPADEVHVRDRATTRPATDTLAVPVGVSDVVALTVDPGGAAARVQLVRGVTFDADQRVALDVGGLGTALVPIEVTLGGDPPTQAVVRLITAGATTATLSATSARVVPTQLIVPGDVQTVEAIRGDAWARGPADEQGRDLPHPGVSPAIGFTWPAQPTWTWRSLADYRATLTVTGDGGGPAWTLFAYPDALATRVAGDRVAQPMPAPTVDGWDPAYWPSPPYTWSARLTHDRDDGDSEGFADRATIAAP